MCAEIFKEFSQLRRNIFKNFLTATDNKNTFYISGPMGDWEGGLTHSRGVGVFPSFSPLKDNNNNDSAIY